VLRLAFLALLLASLAGTAFAQHEDEEDNEFARRTSTEFTTVAPARERDGLFAAAGTLESLLQLDNILTSGPGYTPFSALFGEAELRGYVAFTELITINGLFRIEQARNQSMSGAFVDQNLYTQRLFAVVNVPPLYVYGGKIHPRFGVAWFSTPGIYGDDFADDYEIQERLGFGIRADARFLGGHHRLTAELFQADASPLGRSPFGPQAGDSGFKRQAVRTLADGGVSNTGAFESFSVAYSVHHFGGVRGLGGNLGIAKQKASATDLRDEWSWVVGAHARFPLTEAIRLLPMVEVVGVKGQAGLDRDTDYVTAGLTLRIGDAWAFGLHGTTRDVRDRSNNDFRTDLLYGLGVAYDLGDGFKDIKFLDGFSLVAGWRHDRRSGIERDTLGLQVRYQRDF
jgi:hypothetical protein